MSERDGLDVWHERRLVGHLWRDATGAMGFRYHPTWASGDGFAVSLSLPLEAGDFPPSEGTAHRFFANLLPEGGVREHVVRDLKLPNTDFDLLRAIGGECAGALSVLPAGRRPSGRHRYDPLAETALFRLASRKGRIYAAPGGKEEGPRLSLAGAQDKCPVLFDGAGYHLPKGEAPSTHILKFEAADYRHVPAYEVFTTRLAAAAGLPVSETALCAVRGARFARITRYDRPLDGEGGVRRLHQEDFCQALGYGYERKYQEHGGPSFARCYRLVMDASDEPALDGRHLLRWQIFNVLAGNSDGHTKNLSLLHLEGDATRLAPFYDLVCTRAVEGVDERLAFDVGGECRPGMVAPSHWEALARRCDVRPAFLLGLLGETAEALLGRLAPELDSFQADYGPYPALQRVTRIVTRQCARALKRA